MLYESHKGCRPSRPGDGRCPAGTAPPALMKPLFFRAPSHLAFKWHFDHLVCSRPHLVWDDAMPLLSEHHDPGELEHRLRDAHAVTSRLIAEVIGETCRRFPSAGQIEKTARIEQLIGSRAWTDAALALIDLELPLWQVRRIAYDDGEWYCALSRERELPDWLDESVETRHADLPLALLNAYMEVFRKAEASRPRPSVPEIRPTSYECVCCENFF
jgi:hypothetical protein